MNMWGFASFATLAFAVCIAAIAYKPPSAEAPAPPPKAAVSIPLTGAQQAWVRDCILHNRPGGNGAQYDVDRCIEYAHLLPWSE